MEMAHWQWPAPSQLHASKELGFPYETLGRKVAIMMETKLNMAEIMLIAGTRIVLGAGIGLLLSTRMNNDQRKAAGLSLALVGGLTTIPLVMDVISKKSERAEIRKAA